MSFNLDDYEPVASRIHRFYGDHPNGAIHTEMVFDDGERVVIRATVYRDLGDPMPAGIDYAEEILTDRGVNSTSALENCETSAIGRALANAGYAAKGKRASREEMTKVAREEFKPKYGAPGSKSAAMEYALHLVDSQLKDIPNEPVPVAWSVGESVTQIGQVPDAGFTCRHGSMVKKEGVAKGTNKPYAGYVCSAPKAEQCDAKWAKLTANGTWFWPDDSEPGKGGE